MATLYLKTAGGNFNGANWSTVSSAGVDSNTPTAADNCIVELGSGALTVNAGSVCRSLDFTAGAGAYTGTVTHTAAVTLTIGDGTAGTGNVALKLTSGMTYTLGSNSTSSISFVSTSATVQTVTTAGRTIGGGLLFNGVGGSWQLADNLVISTTTTSNALLLTNGTLDTNGKSITAGRLDLNNAGTRTLTMGASAWSLATTATGVNVQNATNLTITANTAVFTCSGGSVSTLSNVSQNMNGASLVLTGGGSNGLFGGTWKDITVTGTAAKTNVLLLQADPTCTGTIAVNSNSLVNRVLVASSVRGTTRTITAATAVLGNVVDFMDVTGAGAATWTAAGTGATSIGDCGGNSGITFTTPITCYAKFSATSNWSDAIWFTTSGGATPARVPLPQDDAIFDANTTATAARQINFDMPRIGKNITLNNVLSSTNFNLSITTDFFGAWSMSTAISLGQATGVILRASGRSTYTITSGPNVFSSSALTIDAVGGTYNLQDALTLGGSTPGVLTVTNGAFNANGYNVSVGSVSASGSTIRALTMGSGAWSLTSLTGTVWTTNTTTGLTFNTNTAVITITTASAQPRTFAGGGLTFYSLVYTVANSNGALLITGANIFTTFTPGPQKRITWPSNVMNTIGNSPGSGVNNGYVYGGGDSYLASIPDSAATSIANDIDIRLRVALDDVTRAGAQRIAAKYGAAGQRSYRWYITAGGMTFEVSNDGTNAALTANATATLTAAGLSSGTTYWFRVARDRTGGTVKFYYAADNVTMPSGGGWTQLGSTLSGLSTATIFDSTTITTVGGEQTATNSNPGKYYRAQICSNLLDDGSAIQADINLSTKAFGVDTFTESSSNAATVTINGASIVGDGRLAFDASSAGTPAYISKPSGGAITGIDYLVVKDIRIEQALNFYVGANTILVSGNTGIYTAATTYTHKQSAANYTGVASTSLAASFPTSTTVGSLLVAFVNSAGTTGGGSAIAGWTQAVTSASGTVSFIYYKVADGTETSISYSQVTSRVLTIGIVEYTGFTGTPTLDVTDSNSSGGAVNTLSTTATTGPTNTAQPALALAYSSASSSLTAWLTATNSFIPDFTVGTQGSGQQMLTVAKELTTTAAVETTLGWTTARAGITTGLVVFKNAGVAWTQSASDSVTITDAAVKAIGSTKTDSVAVADASAKAVGSNKADSVTSSDAANKTIGLTKTDVVAPQDAFNRAVAYVRAASDIVTILDAFSYSNATVILQVISALLESDSKDLTMQSDDKGLVLESDDNDIVIENEVI